jgi:hypothetical protein
MAGTPAIQPHTLRQNEQYQELRSGIGLKLLSHSEWINDNV